MNRDSQIVAKATAMLVAETRDSLAMATASLVGETRKELTKEIAARTAGAATAAAAMIAPAIAAAEARKAALMRVHQTRPASSSHQQVKRARSRSLGFLKSRRGAFHCDTLRPPF